MRVVIFGATGMIGQGVLRECLLAGDVSSVVSVVRTPTGHRHAKLREVVHSDFTDFTAFSAVDGGFAGADACFFCLGAASAGMSEADYTRVTYDFTLAAARALAALNPDLTFIYVSGAGTAESGRAMWARVKGRTETAVLELFRNGYAFRPAFVQPMYGERPRARSYRIAYAAMRPLFPVIRRLIPRQVTTTEHLGRMMLEVARNGFPKRILEPADLMVQDRR